MKNEIVPALVVAALVIVVAVVFKSLLGKSADVVPLYLIPVLLYVGYLTRKSAKIWLATTVAITMALSLLYAVP